MKALSFASAAVAAASFVLAIPALASATDREMDLKKNLKGRLSGEEVVPCVVTHGRGDLKVEVRSDGSGIDYELSYEGLRGTVTEATLGLGQRGASGNRIAYLCSNLKKVPSGTPPCPVADGTVTGTLYPDDVLGSARQGLAAGEIGDLIEALRTENVYVSIRTSRFPKGEIRAQIK